MSDLRAARLTGVLFIIATVVNLLGAAVRPGLTGTDYLGRLSARAGPGGGRLAAPAHRGVRVCRDRRRDVPRPEEDGTRAWPLDRSSSGRSRRSCTRSPS